MAQKEALFDLGRVLGTPGALSALMLESVDVQRLIAQHAGGDFGQLSQEDRDSNRKAVECGGRVVSSYPLPSGVLVWVITEADRSATTVLLPSEY